MYCLLFFSTQNLTDGLRYPLPPYIDVAILDAALMEQKRERIMLPELEVFSEEALLESWRSGIESVLEVLAAAEERTLIFPTNHHLSLFHILKGKCRLHAGSKDNGILEGVAGIEEGDWSFDKMISSVRAIGDEVLPTHPAVFAQKSANKDALRENMLMRTSFSYIADTSTGVFHVINSPCLSSLDPARWRGLGKDPLKSGFRPCPACAKDAFPRSRTSKPSRRMPTPKSKSQIMREQLILICEQYGMHAEVVGGIVYVTTIAGEWYFNYNDRPIQLRHQNTEKRMDRDGNTTGHYHTQQLVFHAPLQALAYIRNHERAEIRRKMEI